MAYLDDLAAARDSLATELKTEAAARVTAQAAGQGVKTTYSAGGRNVDWNGYLAAMTAQIAAINKMINDGDASDDDENLFELITRAY
jgi:hypothetical protein